VLGAQPNRAMGLYFMMSEPDIATALRWPWMSIGSDAGANEAPARSMRSGCLTRAPMPIFRASSRSM